MGKGRIKIKKIENVNRRLWTRSPSSSSPAPARFTISLATGLGWERKLNNLAIQLWKNCNHPDLLAGQIDGSYFYLPIEDIVGQYGKFRLLERLLVRLFAKNHRVLVFTQWTKNLDIMDYYFSEKGFEVCRIDGNVKLEERRRQIDEFNDEKSSCRIFLFSTRAGGLGINLTAVDTCILYDSDYNPQMDLQAMDRCHRIGPKKPVHVYRLVTAQSIEGQVLKRAYSKLKLEHVVLGKGKFHQERANFASTNVHEASPKSEKKSQRPLLYPDNLWSIFCRDMDTVLLRLIIQITSGSREFDKVRKGRF